MSNLVYPSLPGLAFPVVRVPTWKSNVMESASGREFRAGLMTYPRYKYQLKYEFLRDTASLTEMRTLLGFFNQVRGDFDTWLFTDPDDNSVTAQQFGTGNGATKTFQLVRTNGGFAEPVYDLNGNPSVYVAGVLKTLGTDYTISSGLVTFTAAPANGAVLTWTGSFYWRCRFTTPTSEFSKFMNTLWEAGKVEFITCKP